MRKPRGERQRQILEYVRKRLLAGSPPTVREIQEAVGLRAVQSVQVHLEALVAAGSLTKGPGSRGYRLPTPSPPPRFVPILGRVQAGALSEAIESIEGYVPMSEGRDDAELFALRVGGESMLGAGILPGDLVIVRRQLQARSGDIVVALVGDEATVKRLGHASPDRIELHAENPAFPPIVITPPDEVQLLGKVIEVRRFLEPNHG